MTKRLLNILIATLVIISLTSPGLAASRDNILYSIQVGAYLEQQNAERMITMLRGRGYKPYIYQKFNAKRQKLYIVRIGDYNEPEQALSALTQFKTLEKMPAFITKSDSITPINIDFPVPKNRSSKKVITQMELAKIDGRAGTVIPSDELAIIDGQTGSIMPADELAAIDGQTGTIMMADELATVDGQTGSLMPADELATIDGQTGTVMPSGDLSTIDGQTGTVMPSGDLSTIDGQTGTVMPSGDLSTIDGQTGTVMPSGDLSTVDGQTGSVIPSDDLSTVDGQTGPALPKGDLPQSEPLVAPSGQTEGTFEGDAFGGMFEEDSSDTQGVDSSTAKELRQQIATLEEKVNELREEADVRKILEITEEEREQEEDQILSATGRDYTMAPKGSLGLDYGLNYTHNTPDTLSYLDELPKVEHNSQHTLSNSLSVSYAVRDNISLGASIPFIYKYDSMGTENSRDVTDLGDISFNLRIQPIKAGGRLPPFIVNLGYTASIARSPYEIDPNVEMSTASGYNSVRGGVSLSHKLDPIVVFGGLNFSHGFTVDGLDQKYYGRLKEVEPGQSLALSSGLGYALSYRLTLNLSFSFSYSFGRKNIYNFGETALAESSSSSFTLGTGWRLSPTRSINVSIAKGLSRDSADFSISLSMPFNL